jgi:hypothetical protein
MPYKHFILDIQALECWKGCLAFGWRSQFWVDVANFLDVMSDERQGGTTGDRKRHPIGINLTESSSTSVGAREVESGWEGLYGRPRPVPLAHLWGNVLTPPPPGDHKGLVKKSGMIHVSCPSPHHPPSPLQNPRLALTHQSAPFCLSDVSVVTDALLFCKAEMNLLDCCASPLIIKLGAKPKMTAAIR